LTLAVLLIVGMLAPDDTWGLVLLVVVKPPSLLPLLSEPPPPPQALSKTATHATSK
jgi:hypothetical protein